MLSTQELKINYKQIPDRIREYFGSRVATAEEDHWRHDLLSQTMLVRDDDGYYRPAHKSLVEFFSAYKLAATIGALKEEYVEAAAKHANVDRSLKPAEQQWSVYFRATGGVGEVLAPLARFAKDSRDELAKTWDLVSLDDATSEFILLMCGQPALLDYVKNQNSTDEIEGRLAARALQVAAFPGDLHGGDLAGAIITDCHLRECNLGNVDLSNSSWLEGSIGRVSFDRASLRGVCFRNITFVDVTFRNADLSDSRFEENVPFYFNIVGGIWCTRDHKEILLVVLVDGRFIAITPEALVVQTLAPVNLNDQELTSEELAIWLVVKSDTLYLDGLGYVSLDHNAWHWNLDWRFRELAPGLKSEFSEWDDAGGDVQMLDFEVTVETTKQVLLSLKLHDTTNFSSADTVLRAMAVSKNGKQAAVIHGSFGEMETASIRSGDCDPGIPLHGFRGVKLERELPNTTDHRGAAFSPSGKILAVKEQANIVGFWRTDNGECLGRVVFHPAAHGCVVGGATGLPADFVTANSGENDGWIVEASS